MSKSSQRRAVANFRLRAVVSRTVGGASPAKGGILRALMASPLIGSELDLSRLREEGRTIDI